MTHLSATQMINQLNTTNMTQFEKTNGLVYGQPKNANERKLSPWFAKRRYSKSIKVDKKPQEEEKNIQSDKTAQFLKKIFPRKRNKQPDKKTTPLYQQKSQLIKITAGQTAQEEEGSNSIIFLPIKPINFEKIKTVNQHFHTERKAEAGRKYMNIVQPQVFDPPCLNRSAQNIQQSPKSSSLAFTFRKNWKKKERIQTQPAESLTTKKRMSIDQIYHLIGKEKATNSYRHYSYQLNEDLLFDKGEKIQESTTNPWLVPRSMKKNHKSSKFKTFVCKTQYI